jgi:LuxR family maltose regulon positive regulatory protein
MKAAGERRSGKATGMPVLASKLVAPSMPGRVVERPRLFKLLDAGVEGPVTLVAAPAGSGKTLLLTSWMSAGSPPGQVAWLSLDQGDNDPVRFWTYVLAALGRSGALPAGSGLEVLVPSAQDDDALLPMLLHGLEELASPLVLVLDDVHELTQPRVLHGIELLVRHAPPQLRLVLSTRADPPLPLHRRLVSGQLTRSAGPTWPSPSPRSTSCLPDTTTGRGWRTTTWPSCRPAPRDGRRACPGRRVDAAPAGPAPLRHGAGR